MYREAGIAILKPYHLPPVTVDYLNFYPAPKYFANVSDFDDFIFRKNQKNSMENTHKLPEDGRTLYNIYKDLNLNSVATTKSKTEAGCQDSCLQRSPVYQLNGQTVQVMTYALGNEQYRRDLVIFDANGAIKGSLFLLGDQVSLYIHIERNPLGLPTRVTIFNRYSEVIFEKTYEALDAQQVQKERTSLSNYNEKHIQIGVCESDITPKSMKEIGYNKNILLGPNLDTSYYGWQNKKDSPQNFFLAAKT